MEWSTHTETAPSKLFPQQYASDGQLETGGIFEVLVVRWLPQICSDYIFIHHGHVQLCIARPNMNFPLPPTHKIRPMVIWIVHFWQRGSSLRQVMATATTVGKSRESSIGSAAIMVTMISMLGKSCASVGAIRKVRFEEKPDSIYRAVSCICPDWSVSWSVSSR